MEGERNKQNCGYCLVNILRANYPVLNQNLNDYANLHDIST